jgi:hypothetical protein
MGTMDLREVELLYTWLRSGRTSRPPRSRSSWRDPRTSRGGAYSRSTCVVRRPGRLRIPWPSVRLETDTTIIGGADSVRQFVKEIPEDFFVAIVEGGRGRITDQVVLTPLDLLAELAPGDQYGFAYEPTGHELFEPGDVTITPGVHSLLGAEVGERVHAFLNQHLAGFTGRVDGEDLEMNRYQIGAHDEPFVMSVFDVDHDPVWVISQYGYTTVLLPEEY